jgi:iron(III) transport system permease protein
MGAVPWIALMTAASMRTVERRLEEESLLDASPLRVLCRVTLRRGAGGVLAAALWVTVICATEIAVTDLFQIRTFAEEIYTQASLGGLSESSELLRSDFAVGVVLIALLAALALTHTMRWFSKISSIAIEDPWLWRPQRRRFAISGLLFLLLAIVVLVPLAGLIWKAGMAVHQRDEHFERSWSAVKAAAMVLQSPMEHRREWGWSLAIGSMAAVTTAVLAVLLGWWWRLNHRVAQLQLTAIALALAVPAPLWGVWAIELFNQPRYSVLAPLAKLYDESLVVSALVQVARALPIALLWMSSQFSSVPQELLEAARSEGAGPMTQLFRIGLPLRWAAVATTAGLAFVLSLGELSATLLVLPPGVTTISVRIFQLLHYGVDDRVAALALSVFALAGGAVAAWRLGQILRR